MKTIVKHYRIPYNVAWLFGGDVPKELVQFLSVRYRRGSKDFVPATGGGYTTYTIRTADGGVEVTGVAICRSSDNFCYREGRERAQNNAERLWAEFSL